MIAHFNFQYGLEASGLCPNLVTQLIKKALLRDMYTYVGLATTH